MFYNFALRRVPVGRISLMYPLTGPIGATMSWLIIDSPISTKVFISLAIILSFGLWHKISSLILRIFSNFFDNVLISLIKLA